jgi:hypothetical protein
MPEWRRLLGRHFTNRSRLRDQTDVFSGINIIKGGGGVIIGVYSHCSFHPLIPP